jgi:hypothetical protein
LLFVGIGALIRRGERGCFGSLASSIDVRWEMPLECVKITQTGTTAKATTTAAFGHAIRQKSQPM